MRKRPSAVIEEKLEWLSSWPGNSERDRNHRIQSAEGEWSGITAGSACARIEMTRLSPLTESSQS